MSICWKQLCRRGYFKRTWIIQEVMLSSELIVMIGSERLRWSMLERELHQHINSAHMTYGEIPVVVKMHMELSQEYGKVPSSPQSIRPANVSEKHEDGDAGPSSEAHAQQEDRLVKSTSVARNEAYYISLPYRRLFGLLRETCTHKCTDVRDKLFALLSMFKEPLPELLRPDYGKTALQVFTDLSWFLIDYDIPEALSAACEDWKSEIDSCPPWMADWTVRSAWRAIREDHCLWRAGYAQGHRRIFAKRLGTVLHLRGRVIDRVETVTSVWAHSRSSIRKAFMSLADFLGVEDFGGSDGPAPRVGDRHCRKRHNLPHEVREELLLSLTPLLESETESLVHVGRPTVRATVMGGRKWHEQDIHTKDLNMESEEAFKVFAEAAADPSSHGKHWRVHKRVVQRCRNLRLIRTRMGLSGIGSPDAHPGDVVCVLLGFHVPFLLRPVEQGWKLVGECLVGGIMYGEAVNHLDWSRIDQGELVRPLQDFMIH